jgi:hypothetical protein
LIYKALREQNAERLRTLRADQAEHLARNPELLVEQCRRLVAEQAKTKIVERSADIPGVVFKRRDDSRSDETQMDSWWDEKFVATFADAWPLMFERMTQQFEATNAGLRAEISELRDRLRDHVHTNNDEM